MSRHIFTHIPILALYFLGEKQTALFLLINLYISLYLLNKPIFKEFKEKALDRYSGVFDLFYTLVTIYIVFRSIGFSKQRWN
jgi:hypothetical protein